MSAKFESIINNDSPRRLSLKEDDRSVSSALKNLCSPNALLRVSAARTLGELAESGIKNPKATLALITSLKMDRDPGVRQEAAWSLWKLGDERAHMPLVAALMKDPSICVRANAARALGLMKVSDTSTIMINMLELGRHIPAKLRAALASALGNMCADDAIHALAELTGDVDPCVRAEAIYSLGRIAAFKNQNVELAFNKIKRHVKRSSEPVAKVRRSAIRALKFLRTKESNMIVIKALKKDPDSFVRLAACETLLVWDSHATEEVLVDALSDNDWSVRKSAASTLARFIRSHRIYNSAKVCEALSRISRMFPSASFERSLALDAITSIK